jgi:hypothetical protein
MIAAQPEERGKGAALLLEHCAALDLHDEDVRPPAFERLEALIGAELAGRLVQALAWRPSRLVA